MGKLKPESPIFDGKNHGFRLRFSLKHIVLSRRLPYCTDLSIPEGDRSWADGDMVMATKFGNLWNEYRNVMEIIVRIWNKYLYIVCIYIYGNETCNVYIYILYV